MVPLIHYGLWGHAWGDYKRMARGLAQVGARERVSVCDLGGGAKPVLPLSFIEEHDLDYVVVDISDEELDKAPHDYRKLRDDVTRTGLAIGSYDVVLSQFLIEHIRDARQLHANVFSMLNPGGHALHFFPTLYGPPFLVNRLVPEHVTAPLLQRLQSGREPEGESAKFRAYYRWCRGPTARQIARFEDVGFDVEEYVGYFGHGYFERFPWLEFLQRRVMDGLLRRPMAALTTFAIAKLGKPIQTKNDAVARHAA